MALRFLSPFGLCTFYADESDDKFIYTIACVAIPSLVKHGLLNRNLTIAWDRYLGGAKAWRKGLREQFGVSITQELKGSKSLLAEILMALAAHAYTALALLTFIAQRSLP
jgi:hypothetical protein